MEIVNYEIAGRAEAFHHLKIRVNIAFLTV